ncbi:hypothetical protein LCGC14_2252290 [marine sediment metagenome]|uniref:Uncharacterized protein n=1 Tax=marine sediment metagenome TaxID=412755 RepID=A0A0F9FX93_9ZZZZ
MVDIENRAYVKSLEVVSDLLEREFEVHVVYRVPYSLAREGTNLMVDVLAETVAQQVKEVVWKIKRGES